MDGRSYKSQQAEAYLGVCQIPMMEIFRRIVNEF